jgi:predicted alpha/beta hydrolase family esterase
LRYIIIPGLGNSGPAHWQSLWQNKLPGAVRCEQQDWENPRKADWLATLDGCVQSAEDFCVLIAHSLGVALVAHWAMEFHSSKVAGALLVSPSDVDSPAHTPNSVRNFAPMPLMPLPFRSIVVASSNDRFVTLARAEQFAKAWQAQFVSIGPCGHINTDSGLGDWPQGMEILRRL